MTGEAERVRAHYQAEIGDPAALLARLAQAPGWTAEVLAPLDQFHLGGLAATAALAARAGITAGMGVLDAGSGLGGPARLLATQCGCQVTGVDLSPDYVAVARFLTERAGLAARVAFQAGDITALPFAGGRFDAVWTQHVAMNVRDRTGLYRELRRVLRPGGRLAFYDPAALAGAEPLYPVPWAESAAASALRTEAETRAALAEAGFKVEWLEDASEQALAWAAAAPRPAEGVTLAAVMGPRMPVLAANYARNVREGRVRVLMGVCEAA